MPPPSCHPWTALKRPILNRVQYFWWNSLRSLWFHLKKWTPLLVLSKNSSLPDTKHLYLCLSFPKFQWAFLPVESKTNLLYININFTGNLFFGFTRYCSKVFLEPTVSHPFWAPALTKNVLSIFFPYWLKVNDHRNKMISLFLLRFIGFGKIIFYVFLYFYVIYLFFIKICFRSNLQQCFRTNYKQLQKTYSNVS